MEVGAVAVGVLVGVCVVVGSGVLDGSGVRVAVGAMAVIVAWAAISTVIWVATRSGPVVGEPPHDAIPIMIRAEARPRYTPSSLPGSTHQAAINGLVLR